MHLNYAEIQKIKEYKGNIKFPDFGLKTELYNFQKIGLLYLYKAKRALLCDATGCGKTIECLALFKFLEKFTKEENRWLIVVPANAVFQWENEMRKFTNYRPYVAVGDRQERVIQYMMRSWQFLIISYQILQRDWEILNNSQIKNFVFDDGHFFKHHEVKTAHIVKELTKDAERIVICTATPIQKSLLDIHSLFQTLGLDDVFGNEFEFRNKYCVTKTRVFNLKNGRVVRKLEIVGHKNLDDFKQKAYPYFIKRTFRDVGKELPALIVNPIYLGMHQSQKEFYDQAKNEIIKAWDEGRIRDIKGKGFHSVMQSLAGTATAGLQIDESVKLDFVEFFVKERMQDQDKVVVYSFYKRTVEVLLERLAKMGIKNVITITGDDGPEKKEAKKLLFTKDPSRRILIGTGAVETSMNIQAANYLVMVDLIFNQARVVQLVGRIRRLGSKFENVVLYVLLTKGTVEERLWKKLNYEACLVDRVFDEKSDVFDTVKFSDIIGALRS